MNDSFAALYTMMKMLHVLDYMGIIEYKDRLLGIRAIFKLLDTLDEVRHDAMSRGHVK